MTRSELTALRAAVIGSGVMGAGIAQVLASAGVQVSLYDPDAEALAAALARVRRMAERLGQPTDWIGRRLTTTNDLAKSVSGVAIAIEAGPEDLDVKRAIFRSLSNLAPRGAVLASNTSAIPIREIAAELPDRGRILGTHFWHPPQLVPLVEVVKSDATEDGAVDWTVELLQASGMAPVRINADVPGFVGNRLQHALKREAIALVAAGVCDAETIDTVVKAGFGIRLAVLGPLEQADLGGLDLTFSIHSVVMPALDNTPVVHPLLRAKVEHGELGAKSGRGFREWAPGEAEKLREAADAFLLEAARRRSGS